MSQWIEVQPAYGRDYANQKLAQADWDADKDFSITEPGMVSGARFGMAVNKSQAVAMNLRVTLRYGKPKSGGPGLKVMSFK